MTVTAEGSVMVSWQAPESGGGPVGYIVHIKPGDGGGLPGRKRVRLSRML